MNLKIAEQNRDPSTSKKETETRGKDKKSKKKKSKNRKRRNSSSSSSSDSSDSSESSSGSDSDSSESTSSTGKKWYTSAPNLTYKRTDRIFLLSAFIRKIHLLYNKYLIFSQGYDRLILCRVIGKPLFLFGLLMINKKKPPECTVFEALIKVL